MLEYDQRMVGDLMVNIPRVVGCCDCSAPADHRGMRTRSSMWSCEEMMWHEFGHWLTQIDHTWDSFSDYQGCIGDLMCFKKVPNDERRKNLKDCVKKYKKTWL